MEEIIIKKREFEEKIVQTINESKLPAFIIKPIIKELYEQINTLEQQQYEQACKAKEKEEKENG